PEHQERHRLGHHRHEDRRPRLQHGGRDGARDRTAEDDHGDQQHGQDLDRSDPTPAGPLARGRGRRVAVDNGHSQRLPPWLVPFGAVQVNRLLRAGPLVAAIGLAGWLIATKPPAAPTPVQTARPTLAQAWPRAAIATIDGQLPDGATYTPWLYVN